MLYCTIRSSIKFATVFLFFLQTHWMNPTMLMQTNYSEIANRWNFPLYMYKGSMKLVATNVAKIFTDYYAHYIFKTYLNITLTCPLQEVHMGLGEVIPFPANIPSNVVSPVFMAFTSQPSVMTICNMSTTYPRGAMPVDPTAYQLNSFTTSQVRHRKYTTQIHPHCHTKYVSSVLCYIFYVTQYTHIVILNMYPVCYVTSAM